MGHLSFALERILNSHLTKSSAYIYERITSCVEFTFIVLFLIVLVPYKRYESFDNLKSDYPCRVFLIWTQKYEIVIMKEELSHKTENVSKIKELFKELIQIQKENYY
mgnify:CR=1 FL=1